MEFLEKNVQPNSKHTLKELFDSYNEDLIKSTPGIRTDLFKRKLDEVLITDFFGNVQNVEVDRMREHEDLAALSRLAANLTAISRPDICGGESQKPAHSSSTGLAIVSKQYPQHQRQHQHQHHRQVDALRVEEKDSWGRTVIGGGALVACTIAWVVSSFL